ncbi:MULTISPECIES: response regulator [Sphingosinicellaceae]|uniref:response regulator n=1 Tax=Sphingosinicellaceae TaxID=2820280 RepID=UPI001C1E7661|nr:MULTISPECIES: response regulator [Polymorphobacter]QYE33533.1 response regulator [Polymorphobacter sp. PAMC 29334]UAJ12227.1 response regulator [Polymorphobacter megasporae]
MTERPKPRVEEALLLVDGEVIARHALAEYLQHCGYAVIAAASTEEAMTVLNAPDYVISAMLCALPAIGSQNGFAFCRWVRDNHPTIEIALAGTLDAAAEAAAEFCDAGPRLVRPYDPGAIVERVQLMRERRRQKLALG